MNTDQIKGKAKDVAGSVQRKAGEAIDSPEQQAKGAAKQVEGKSQKLAGDVKERAKEAADEARDADVRPGRAPL